MSGDLPLFIGSMVDGRYQIERRLGRGAMGEVYRAWDVKLKRPVAIKRPMETAHDRFEVEASLLARLRSPHVATIYSFGSVLEAPFFAMEFVDGPTLATVLQRHAQRGARLPVLRAIRIAREISQALSEAHGIGVVHCDIKPANVLVEHDTGRVVLVDFGIAESLISAKPSDEISGTLEYIAPELLHGQRPTARADVFSLGVLTYEMLTGGLPFRAAELDLSRPDRPAPPPPSRSAADAAPFDGVVLRALDRDPLRRYPSMAALRAALDGAQRTPAEVEREPSGVYNIEEGSLRVMVVEDDDIFARLVTRGVQIGLAGVPIEVTRAGTCVQALQKCARRMPQLILLDYHLTDGTGVELLARIRRLPEGDSARVIVVTGGADDDAVVRFSALGVRRFARKPLDLVLLVELVTTIAASAGWLPPTEG